MSEPIPLFQVVDNDGLTNHYASFGAFLIYRMHDKIPLRVIQMDKLVCAINEAMANPLAQKAFRHFYPYADKAEQTLKAAEAAFLNDTAGDSVQPLPECTDPKCGCHKAAEQPSPVLKSLSDRLEALESYVFAHRTLEKTTDADVADMERRLRNQQASLERYSACLDGLSVNHIPGSGMDGCRSPDDIRRIVEYMTRTDFRQQFADIDTYHNAQRPTRGPIAPGEATPQFGPLTDSQPAVDIFQCWRNKVARLTEMLHTVKDWAMRMQHSKECDLSKNPCSCGLDSIRRVLVTFVSNNCPTQPPTPGSQP